MDVPPRALQDRTVIAAPRRFDLVGVRGGRLDGSGLELRVAPAAARPGVRGCQSAQAPPTGLIPLRPPASDPVWAGGADELQLRSHGRLEDLRLKFVSVPAAPRVHAKAARPQRSADERPRRRSSRARTGCCGRTARTLPSYGAINVAFVHHTVNANDYAPSDSPRIVLAIAKYHIDHNGWNDIGYNFLVDKYGQVFEGRAGGIEQAVIGARPVAGTASRRASPTSAPITRNLCRTAAESVLARLIAWKLSLHAVPLSGTVRLASVAVGRTGTRTGRVILNRISGHRDGLQDRLPGAALYAHLDDLRGRVAALDGVFAVAPARDPAVASSLVAYGEAASCFRSSCAADDTPISGAAIAVQKQSADGRWAVVAKTSTSADGVWAAPVTWRRNRRPAGGRDPSRLLECPLCASDGHGAQQHRGDFAGAQLARSGAGPRKGDGTVSPAGSVVVQVERKLKNGRWVAAGRVSASLQRTHLPREAFRCARRRSTA